MRLVSWSCVACVLLGAVILHSPVSAQVRGEAPSDAAVYAVSYVAVMPSSGDAAVAALRRYRDTSRMDPGYVRLELFEQLGRRGHFAIVETWADQSAFAAHGTAAHTTQLLSTLQSIQVSDYDQRPYKTLTVTSAPGRAAADTIHVITHVDTVPAPQRDAPGLLRRLADASRKDEGNLRFDVVRHATRANHFTIVEAWQSQAALDAHAAAPHTREYRKALQPMSGSPLDERLYRAVE
jgi:quinol monooxygenase YgiN